MRIDTEPRTQLQLKPEAPDMIKRFKKQVLRRLKKHGAIVYNLTGKTIYEQKEERDNNKKPSFYYFGDDERILTQKSLSSQVAIFCAPQKLFVPYTQGANKETLEAMIRHDESTFKKPLGLERTKLVIPNTATLTEATFLHYDKKGEWLLANTYGITDNPIANVDSQLVCVGGPLSDSGLGMIFSKNDKAPDYASAVRMLIPGN